MYNNVTCVEKRGLKMKEKTMEFVRIVVGLREEYQRNQKRLDALKEMIKLDPEKYTNYFFFIKKTNERINLYLQLVKKQEPFRQRIAKRLLGQKEDLTRTVTLDEDGLAQVSNTDSIILRDETKFSTLVQQIMKTVSEAHPKRRLRF